MSEISESEVVRELHRLLSEDDPTAYIETIDVTRPSERIAIDGRFRLSLIVREILRLLQAQKP